MDRSRRTFLTTVCAISVGSGGCLRLRGNAGTTPTQQSPTQQSPTSPDSIEDIPATTERWQYSVDAAVNDAPVVDGSVLYFASEDGTIHSIDTQGTEQWTTTITGEIEGGLATDSTHLFVGTDSGSVYRLTDEGSVDWSVDVGSTVENPPRVTDTTAYVPTDDGSIVAIATEDGTERWRFQPTPSSANMVPAVDDDRLYIGLYTNSVYALSTDTGDSVFAAR